MPCRVSDLAMIGRGFTWPPASTPMKPMVPAMRVAAIDFSRVPAPPTRSEEHTSELQSLMRISYAVFCLKKKKTRKKKKIDNSIQRAKKLHRADLVRHKNHKCKTYHITHNYIKD